MYAIDNPNTAYSFKLNQTHAFTAINADCLFLVLYVHILTHMHTRTHREKSKTYRPTPFPRPPSSSPPPPPSPPPQLTPQVAHEFNMTNTERDWKLGGQTP